MILKNTYLCILIILFTSCTHNHMPPFSSASQWTLNGNVASSAVCDIAVNFGGNSTLPITNSSNSEYELNFINSSKSFSDYNPFCKKYINSAINKIPLAIDSVEFILADRFMVLTASAAGTWTPDLIRKADESQIVVEANPLDSHVQPNDEIWRNVLFDNKMRRIIVVDRIVKNNRHLAIVYIMQSEKKGLPFTSTFQYDITSKRNTQPVGECMSALLNISIDAINSKVDLSSYNDYIHQADSCYFAKDYAGASEEYTKAFSIASNIPGQHLYNAACAASMAGMNDLAFDRLSQRVMKEPNWYVIDPNGDPDLANLHGDSRWKVFSDTITARRDRIEANYDKPLQAQLLAIAQSDQDIRHKFINAYNATPRNQATIDSLTFEMLRIDSINQQSICMLLDTRGLVGHEKVGNACIAYWMVIQHAPLKLQKKYFPLFEQACQRGDLSKESVAMMDDRIAMYEGRPQKYGSQIVDGKLYQLLNPDKVDEWRLDMGMQPLEDYLRQMGVTQQ